MTLENTLSSVPYTSNAVEKLFLALAKRIHSGYLTITLPDGTQVHCQGRHDGPRADLKVHSPRFYRRLLGSGDLGFAEALIQGECATSDAVALVELAAANEAALDSLLYGRHWLRWLLRLSHRLRPNSNRGAKRNIAHHYDLGNEFYRLWLDERMNYSAGVFPEGTSDEPDQAALLPAQWAKYRRLAELAELKPGDQVLEIGCGWGGFACWAAKEIGCHVTALTISQAQHDFAVQEVRQAGLEDRVSIRLQDYRDTVEQFDKIVSIEMFEAVGEAYWSAYFSTLHRAMKPGGRAALQVITIHDDFFEGYRNNVDFIQRYIFPGGMLPSPRVLRQQVASVGLTYDREFSGGGDYARTLAIWRERFDAAWPEISQQGFDEGFRRMWQYYFDYCQAGFRMGRIDLLQFSLAKN
ncbi:MAG: cyclopropane-fatty-acyl-phospholipid synthase family protein [Pseudomonadota bacterium]